MGQMGLAQETGHPVLVELPRIALTKTVPPAVRKFAVQRPGLLRFLDGAAARRLVLFGAPAGYGKSTLAAEWCQRLRDTGAIVAWLSLDTEDNEPGAFAYHLARAVESAAPQPRPRQRSSCLKHRACFRRATSSHRCSTQCRRSIPRRTCSSRIFTSYPIGGATELMTLFLRYAPSNLHLVLVSRSEPRFSLSRLRLDDELVEVDVSLLKFTLEETTRFSRRSSF